VTAGTLSLSPDKSADSSLIQRNRFIAPLDPDVFAWEEGCRMWYLGCRESESNLETLSMMRIRDVPEERIGNQKVDMLLMEGNQLSSIKGFN
jgi:hypothetical protein